MFHRRKRAYFWTIVHIFSALLSYFCIFLPCPASFCPILLNFALKPPKRHQKKRQNDHKAPENGQKNGTKMVPKWYQNGPKVTQKRAQKCPILSEKNIFLISSIFFSLLGTPTPPPGDPPLHPPPEEPPPKMKKNEEEKVKSSQKIDKKYLDHVESD